MQVNLYSSDSACLLQFSEVEFRSEKAFCLSENCSYNVWFLYYSFNFELGVYNVLYGKRLG
jgi:hypothetical protein